MIEEKWYPIETKPKEGSFLVFIPEKPRNKIQAAYMNPNGVFIVGNCFVFDLSNKPTHWRPEPEYPA